MTRTVTFTINDINGNPKEGAVLVFKLREWGTATNKPIYPRQGMQAVTNASGQGSISLWTNGESEKQAVYQVAYEGSGESARFILPTGESDIDLSDLLINNSPDDLPSQILNTLVDPLTGLIRTDKLPETIIVGLRQGTKAELDAADPPLAADEPAFETDTEVFRVGSIRYPTEATETEAGPVELATEAEVLAVSDVDAVVRAKHMRVKVETGNGNAISIGDLGGNARGNNSITLQPSRSDVTEVASGDNCIAIGRDSKSSGSDNVSIGYQSISSEDFSTAIGRSASASSTASTSLGAGSTASGAYSTSSGYGSVASGYGSTSSGYFTVASQSNSSAFGRRTKSNTANVQELGYWSNATTRAGAVRIHGTRMVAMTLQNRATAYGDGGATAGSEADNTVIREGFAIRRNGDDILIDVNIAGTIKTLNLGTAA